MSDFLRRLKERFRPRIPKPLPPLTAEQTLLAAELGVFPEVAQESWALNQKEFESLIRREISRSATYHFSETRDTMLLKARLEDAFPILLKELQTGDAFEAKLSLHQKPTRGRTLSTKAATILRFITPGLHPELLPILLPRVAQATVDLKKQLASHLPVFGLDLLIPLLLQFMSDRDRSVRSHAKRAAMAAVETGKSSHGFRSAFWEGLLSELAEPKVSKMGNPVSYLVKLDQERALNLLQQDRFLNPAHPLFEEILRTLVNHHYDLGCDRIASLKHALLAANHSSSSGLLGTLLLASADCRCPGIESEVETILHQQKSVPPSEFGEWTYLNACHARLLLAVQIPLFSWQIHSPRNSDEWEQSQVVEDLTLLDFCDTISTAGHQGYEHHGFSNLFSLPESDDPEGFIAMLHRFKLDQHASLMEQAMQMLSQNGQWPSRELRVEILQSRDETSPIDFDDLEVAWATLDRDLVIAREEYVWTHRDELALRYHSIKAKSPAGA